MSAQWGEPAGEPRLNLDGEPIVVKRRGRGYKIQPPKLESPHAAGARHDGRVCPVCLRFGVEGCKWHRGGMA